MGPSGAKQGVMVMWSPSGGPHKNIKSPFATTAVIALKVITFNLHNVTK